MIDLEDLWEVDAELDAIMDAHRHTAYPDGVMDAYIARQRRRHDRLQAEIDEIQKAQGNPAAMARLGVICPPKPSSP